MLKFRLIIILNIVFIFTSCLAPGKDVKTERFSLFLERMLLELNKDEKESPSPMEKFEGIISFKQNDTIVLETFPPVYNRNNIITTTGDNNMIAHQSFYITRDKKQLTFSLDGDSWVSFDEKEMVDKKIFFDTQVTDNSILVKYSMAFRPSDTFDAKKMKFDKKIVNLEKGLVFLNDDESLVNCNLDEVILFVPKNTVLNMNFSLSGNLMQSTSLNNRVKIEAVRDMYVFIKNKSVSLSFDKVSWTSNVLGFDVVNTGYLQSLSNREILFFIDVKAIYDKDSVSTSLLKFLS